MTVDWKNETIKVGIYFYRDEKGKLCLDYEGMQDDLNNGIKEIENDKEKQDKYLI